MKQREKWMLAGALLLAALWAASRTNRGQEALTVMTDAIASNVRGIRNNNPGNIERTGETWQGMAPDQPDPRFIKFSEMRWGVRAAAKLFRNYQTRYNLRSVAQLINRWAPPVENDTGSYVNAVAARVGVDPYAPIDLTNRELAYKFLRAVFRHECGIAAEAIPESTIREGINLA